MYFGKVILLLALLNIGVSYAEKNAAETVLTTSYTSPLRMREAKLERDYHIQEVYFSSNDGEIKLAGEFTRPFGDGPFPGVVMITGSGPHDRNETTAGHRPFLTLSDYLVKKGFAVLRYDDRGVGKSTGEFKSAIVPNFASDAASAMRWLQTQEFVNNSLTGYVGHSEGGLVALLAVQETKSEFLILLAAPVFPLGEILLQSEHLKANLSDVKNEETTTRLRRFQVIFDIISKSQSRERAFYEVKKSLVDLGTSEQIADSWAGAFTSSSLYWAAKYDPSLALKAFQGPILAVYASEDTKILPAQNAAQVRAYTKNEDSKVVIAQGLNHLFQPVKPGSKTKYEENDISFSDASLEIIGNWVEQELKVYPPKLN